MTSNATIPIITSDIVSTSRGSSLRELPIEVLAENINIFLFEIETILQKAPQDLGKFQFTEVTVSAEISAQGKLVLLGTGLETSAKGGLTFKFERRKVTE